MQAVGFPWYNGIEESKLLGELLITKKKTVCWIPGRDFELEKGEALIAMEGVRRNGNVVTVKVYHAKYGVVDCLAIDVRPGS